MSNLSTPISDDSVTLALPPEKAAEAIGVERQTLAKWRSQRSRLGLKSGPDFVRLSNRKVVYRVEDLDKFLCEHLA